MKKQIEIKQEDNKINFSEITKVNFVDVSNEKIIIEVELKK